MRSFIHSPSARQLSTASKPSPDRVAGSQLRKEIKLTSNIESALEGLLTNGLRSFLTMLGIVIGVASVIAAITLTQGETASVAANLTNLGTNVLTIYAGAASSQGAQVGAETILSLTPGDNQALKSLNHVLYVSPAIGNTRGQVIYRNQNWNTDLEGVSNSVQYIQNWPTSHGTRWSDSDEQGGRNVAVIGSTVANALFSATGTEPVGQTIRIGVLPYRWRPDIEGCGE